MKSLCKDCNYFDKEGTDDAPVGFGVCRRHAPRGPGGNTDQPFPWTTVSPEDWCGEHSAFDDRTQFVQIVAGTHFESAR
jgi:hypothetical protein